MLERFLIKKQLLALFWKSLKNAMVKSFINHTITLLMPVLAWVTTDWRPSRRALHRAFAWLVAYSLIALGANALTGGNYFYQRDMPVMGFVGQPWYWLETLALGYAINWAAYGVSQLVDRRDSPVASTPAVLVA